MTILLVTNRFDVTADFVVLKLHQAGVDFVRLNTEDIPTTIKLVWYPQALNRSYFQIHGRKLDFTDIHSVWYRRPVSPVPADEVSDPSAQAFIIAESRAAVAGVWRALDCFWVSHPDKLYTASFKLNQLHVAQKVGFNVPPTLITDIPLEAEHFVQQHPETIYKTVSMGRVKQQEGDAVIFTTLVQDEHFSHLSAVKYAPGVFQEFIRKVADIRVTVIGRRVFAVRILSQSSEETKIDWRKGSLSTLVHEIIDLPQSIQTQCLDLMRILGLQFGAIDLVLDNDGKYQFLEINPNGQWAWLEQLTDIPLSAALVSLLISGDETD